MINGNAKQTSSRMLPGRNTAPPMAEFGDKFDRR
jgi:hypothetical protein